MDRQQKPGGLSVLRYGMAARAVCATWVWNGPSQMKLKSLLKSSGIVPEPGGSAFCYWNGYGSSVTTWLKDAPAINASAIEKYSSEVDSISPAGSVPDVCAA